MGIALIKLKIMPESPNSNLDDIKQKAEKIIKNNSVEGMKITFEEEPIAFGLKALIAGFAIDENKEIEPLQNKITELGNVRSAEISDFRRAFG